MKWITKVFRYHKEWVHIVESLGGKSYSEDIVMESYIKLEKYNCENKIINKGKVSKGYMFFVLRSVFVTYMKTNKGVYKEQIESFLFESCDVKEIDIRLLEKFTEDNSLDREEGYNSLITKMDNEMNNWHWYDKRIFEIYRDTPLSIRGIAKETNISWVNIFHTLKRLNSRKLINTELIKYQ